MRPYLKFLACLPVLLLVLSAHADTMSTYTVSGNLESGDTFSGTFTVDFGQYGNSIVAFDMTTTGGFAGGTFNASAGDASFQNNKNEGGTLYAQIDNGSPAPFFYLLVAPNPDGYSLCTVDSSCGGSYTLVTSPLNYIDTITSASMVVATPEPSSLMLLGTGMLGIAAVTRRKFLKP